MNGFRTQAKHSRRFTIDFAGRLFDYRVYDAETRNTMLGGYLERGHVLKCKPAVPMLPVPGVFAKWWPLALPPNHEVYVADLLNQRIIPSIGVPNLRSAVVLQDGSEPLTVSDDGRLVVWDVSTGQVLRSMDAHVISAQSVDVKPNGVPIATVGADGWMRLWRRDV